MARFALPGRLWGHADFMRLWAAQAISAFGARITREGLPLAAVLTLDATPGQLGVLAALSMGPGLIVGLLAGGLVDRTSRRAILVGADLLRFTVLMTVPVAAWLHLLGMTQLYVVAALVGAATVLFDLADRAFLPTIVATDDLMEANSRLSVTQSTAEIGGPALAGLLFQLLTAPFAIAIDAVTYLVSALFLGGLRAREPVNREHRDAQPLAADLAFGWRTVMADPRVRPLLFLFTLQMVFFAFFGSLYALFALKTLQLAPAALGLTIALGGVGALLGAGLAPLLVRMLGVGPAIIASGVTAAAAFTLIPLAPADPVAGMAFLMASQLVGDAFGVAAMIPTTTLQQTLVAPEALGRVGAIFQIGRGAGWIVGAALCGGLAAVVGVRETLAIACVGLLLAELLLLFSPLRTLRTLG
ncbi:MAG TPA: MFS transporter [Caulobacter sp.]|nr:MFS transporter [Caulobacter sp.]